MGETRETPMPRIRLKLVVGGCVESGVGLHVVLDALSAEEEACGVGVIGGVGVVAFDPLSTAGGGRAAEGAGSR